MKLKYEFEIVEIGDTYAAVPVFEDGDEKIRGVAELNDTGNFIFRKLQAETNREELVKAVFDEYDISEKEAKECVSSFLAILKELNFID